MQTPDSTLMEWESSQLQVQGRIVFPRASRALFRLASGILLVCSASCIDHHWRIEGSGKSFQDRSRSINSSGGPGAEATPPCWPPAATPTNIFSKFTSAEFAQMTSDSTTVILSGRIAQWIAFSLCTQRSRVRYLAFPSIIPNSWCCRG